MNQTINEAGKLPEADLLYKLVDLLEKRWKKAKSPACTVELLLKDVAYLRDGKQLEGGRAVRSVLAEAVDLLDAWIENGKRVSDKEYKVIRQSRAYLAGAAAQDVMAVEMQKGARNASGITAATQQQLVGISARVLGVTTLETRNSDRLDFHEVSVWAIREALEAAYLAGRAAGDEVEVNATSSDGGYTITIQVNTPVSTEELRTALQAAYDEGAAGFFNIEDVANSSTRRIVFSRSLGDDREMLVGRVDAGERAEVAACAQLADEFEEVQTGPDCLTAVIAALRDPSNAVVAGLSTAHEGDLSS